MSSCRILIESLGFSKQQSDILLSNSNKNYGTTIIAGTWGTGKNTTLSTLIHESVRKNGDSKQIISIADPHPYPIEGITQIPVVITKDFDPNIHSAFAQPIRALKRMDPDVVFISEIKDKITCEEYVKAVESSITVNTSIQAANALAIIQRFIGYNISSSIIAQSHFLNTLVYQELLAVNCSHCSIKLEYLLKEDSTLNNEHKNQYFKFLNKIEKKYVISNMNHVHIRNQQGCSHCNNTGYSGRTVCAEVVEINDIMRDMIHKQNFHELKQYWKSLSDKNLLSDNMTGKTAMEHALQKMLQGQIDPLHLKDYFGDIE